MAPGSTSQQRIREAAAEIGCDGYAALAAIRAGMWGAQLSGNFPEWMMGLPPGWLTGVPGSSRNDAVRIAGNGVVPAQAEAATRVILTRALATS